MPNSWWLTACMVLALATAASATATRESVNFDFGWRQSPVGELSPPEFQCPAGTFTNASSIRCNGLTSGGLNTSAEDCQGLCCADGTCKIWQWKDPTDPNGPPGGCWYGTYSQCFADPTWIGGNRTGSGPIPHPTASGPAAKNYSDASWQALSVPHDFLIAGTFEESHAESDGYLSRNSTWYRKHFTIPSDWQGKSIWIRFDGVFHQTTTFLNGQYLGDHRQGYTKFNLRLDNVTGTTYGSEENVLALYINADETSSWWYAGGGMFEHTHLVAFNDVHVAWDGVSLYSSISGINSDGTSATSAALEGWVELQNDSPKDSKAHVEVTVTDASGNTVATGKTASVTVPANSQPPFVRANLSDVTLSNPELWSIQHPTLYTVTTTVVDDDTGATVDEEDTSFGFREIKYSSEADQPFLLNGQPIRHTGFCDHANFGGGVGMSVPDRVELYRAQMMRAVGGNARRFSHNAPPGTASMNIYDIVGTLTMPEHRNFKDGQVFFDAWRALVRNERNHASVAFMSACNEGGCEAQGSTLTDIVTNLATTAHDEAPSAFLVANMLADFGNALSQTIDVQGMSHRPASTFEGYHSQFPQKPLVASECCSCQNDRGEDFPDHTHYNDNPSSCAAQQTQYALGLNYTVGTYTWTLTDYIGEGHTWPRKSSSYGQFDLSGFAKPSAYFYKSMYLSNRYEDTAGKPAVASHPFVKIANGWDPQPPTAVAPTVDTRHIEVFSGAVSVVEMFQDDKSLGKQNVSRNAGNAWSVTYSGPGTLFAVGYSSSGTPLANHTVSSSKPSAAIVLSLDAPAPQTGTGNGKLLSDGEDVAMIRATIVDADGVINLQATDNVTFLVVSGPAAIIGSDNGNPTSITPQPAPWHEAFHGLVRLIVRSTEVAVGSEQSRRRLVAVHGSELAAAGVTVVTGDVATEASTSIVVSASAPGLKSATLEIPLSTDAAVDGVLAAAKSYAAGAHISIE